MKHDATQVYNTGSLHCYLWHPICNHSAHLVTERWTNDPVNTTAMGEATVVVIDDAPSAVASSMSRRRDVRSAGPRALTAEGER